MALHMVDDPQDQQEDYNDNSGGGGGGGGRSGGGGGGLLSFLPLLLGMFGGKGGGKGIIILLVLGGAAYFLFSRGGCNTNTASTIQSLFSKTGYNFDPNETKKASVYEGLEDDNGKNPLPESVSLANFAPQRLNQGQQGSCVAWSSVYAARTIVEAASTGQPGNSTAFSPAFVYNQIGLEGCEGSYIQKAMEFMTDKGVVAYTAFPYDDQDCSRQPNQ